MNEKISYPKVRIRTWVYLVFVPIWLFVLYFDYLFFQGSIEKVFPNLSSSLDIVLVVVSISVMLFSILLSIYPNFLIDNKRWLKKNKVSFFLYATIMIGSLLLWIDYKSGNLFSKSFWDNVLVEAHGMFLDILLFGIILTTYERLIERHKDNERLQEEIEDYNNWKDSEATYRIVGNIKRLVKNGVTGINVRNCYLNEAKLRQICLVKCKLTGSTLIKADLRSSDLTDSTLISTDFTNAFLVDVNFQNSNCINVNFNGSFLGGANFKNVDLSTCSFEGAILSFNTILEGAFVNDLMWIDKQKEINPKMTPIFEKYAIDNTPIQDWQGHSKFAIIINTKSV